MPKVIIDGVVREDLTETKKSQQATKILKSLCVVPFLILFNQQPFLFLFGKPALKMDFCICSCRDFLLNIHKQWVVLDELPSSLQLQVFINLLLNLVLDSCCPVWIRLNQFWFDLVNIIEYLLLCRNCAGVERSKKNTQPNRGHRGVSKSIRMR